MGEGTMTTQAKARRLPKGVGRVTGSGEDMTVDELGLALRMGLGAAPTPALAAEFYPQFQMVEGEQHAEPGEMLEGLPVFSWITATLLGQLAHLTPRHLLDLEALGLPRRGQRRTRRYPLPHAVIWVRGYKHDLQHGPARRLPLAVALARHQLELAERDTGHRRSAY
jgi:hypothetical protein